MNIKQLAAAVSLIAAAGSALAQQTEFVAPDAGFISGKTRAEVAAEVRQARADGSLITNDAYPASAPAAAVATADGRTREQVRGEVVQSAHSRQTPDLDSLYFGA